MDADQDLSPRAQSTIAMVKAGGYTCPQPQAWDRLWKMLPKRARQGSMWEPPPPLILGGWWATNDSEKTERFLAHVAWADRHGAIEEVDRYLRSLASDDWHAPPNPTSHVVGPLGGPMHLPWSYNSKPRLSPDAVSQYLATLRSRWGEVAGKELAGMTAPSAFTGKKRRRLVVEVRACGKPPWGDWSSLPRIAAERRHFTRLRSEINKLLAPHMVDHIDFVDRQRDL